MDERPRPASLQVICIPGLNAAAAEASKGRTQYRGFAESFPGFTAADFFSKVRSRRPTRGGVPARCFVQLGHDPQSLPPGSPRPRSSNLRVRTESTGPRSPSRFCGKQEGGRSTVMAGGWGTATVAPVERSRRVAIALKPPIAITTNPLLLIAWL